MEAHGPSEFIMNCDLMVGYRFSTLNKFLKPSGLFSTMVNSTEPIKKLNCNVTFIFNQSAEVDRCPLLLSSVREKSNSVRCHVVSKNNIHVFVCCIALDAS